MTKKSKKKQREKQTSRKTSIRKNYSLDAETLDLLEQYALKYNMNHSEFIRYLILLYAGNDKNKEQINI